MLIQIPNRNRFAAMLMAMSYIPSQGYQLIINENGCICPVVSLDKTINTVFKSTSIFSYEVEKLLKLSIPDIESIKKFFKTIPARDAVIEYDEHLNAFISGDTKISLNGEDIIPGRVTAKVKFPDQWYKVEITEVEPLYEMCTHKSIGDVLEINTRKIQLYTWDMKINVTDDSNENVGDEFKVLLDRDLMKIATKIHKKVGEGSMYVKVYKDDSVPVVRIYGDSMDYVIFCGKYNKGES